MSKIGIVTGGARGIGEQICRLLHSHGVTVIIVDILVEEGQTLAQELQGSIFKCMDVSKIEEWKELVKEIQKIDYLILNAGMMSFPDKTVLQLKQENPDLTNAPNFVQRAMEVNFFQIIYGVGTISPIMQAASSGSIMVMASIVGLAPWPGDPIYVATKHAIIGYMRSIKKRLTELNIKSYVVCPSPINTDFLGADRDKLPFLLLDPKIVVEAMVDLILSDKPSQTITILSARDPIVQEQKEFVKCFETYLVEEKLKPED